MEKQKNSDIEVEAIFEGAPTDFLPDFEFSFYSEWHQDTVVTCSKTGSKLVNCVIKEPPVVHQHPHCWGTIVRCIIEKHNFKPGRLCVLAHIKWPDPSYKDKVRDDVYREMTDLKITN